MVEALVAGGVMGIEVTYSTPNAPAVVKELYQKYGDQIVLGMGTLTKVEHAQQAMDAGASFLVSPHTDDELAAAMTATGLATMMGATTPSEVVHAYKLGSDVVKLFPGSLGGPAYLKAIRDPLPDIPLMPTGGVRVENIADWFAAGAVAVGAGRVVMSAPICRGRTIRHDQRTRPIVHGCGAQGASVRRRYDHSI